MELEVDRPGGEMQGAQGPRGRGAHVKDADDGVGREGFSSPADAAAAPDDDGAGRGEQVPAAVGGQDRGPVRRDVCDGPPPGARVQEEDSAPRGAHGEQAAGRRRDRRGAVGRGVGRRLGDERGRRRRAFLAAAAAAAAAACTRARKVHRHQRGVGPPRHDDVPSGPRQRSDAGVACLSGQVRRAKGGKGPASGGVDRERGPGGDGDGAAAERGQPLDSTATRSGRAVSLEGRAGGAVDGAGVGSCYFERGGGEQAREEDEQARE